MRLWFFFSILVIFTTAVLAWEKEDHEIFDLVSAIEKAEGKGTSFYSWLGVSSKATTNEIAKAYRKKSMELHPDKNPGVKGMQERFARLGVISKILRNKESRKRYDFFYKNGVPRWRGTGYYYSRYRPGLVSVMVFLSIVSSVLQHYVQRANYKRDRARMEDIIRDAKSAAWGQKLTPVEGERKVKIGIGAPRYDEDGNVVPGRTLEFVVDSKDVYLVDQSSGDMDILDPDGIRKPRLIDTWVIVLIYAALAKLGWRKEVGERLEVDGPGVAEKVEKQESNGEEADKPKEGKKGERVQTEMAGGMRRKTVRRK